MSGTNNQDRDLPRGPLTVFFTTSEDTPSGGGYVVDVSSHLPPDVQIGGYADVMNKPESVLFIHTDLPAASRVVQLAALNRDRRQFRFFDPKDPTAATVFSRAAQVDYSIPPLSAAEASQLIAGPREDEKPPKDSEKGAGLVGREVQSKDGPRRPGIAPSYDINDDED